jgi:hypothetical protein
MSESESEYSSVHYDLLSLSIRVSTMIFWVWVLECPLWSSESEYSSVHYDLWENMLLWIWVGYAQLQHNRAACECELSAKFTFVIMRFIR